MKESFLGNYEIPQTIDQNRAYEINNDGKIAFPRKNLDDVGIRSTFSTFSKDSVIMQDPITKEEITYPTAEHRYQLMKLAQACKEEKCTTEEYKKKRNELLSETDPQKLRDFFNKNETDGKYLPSDVAIERNKDQWMKEVLDAKFDPANSKAMLALLTTGSQGLVAASRDSHWGIGKDGTGDNKLGSLLEERRTALFRSLGVIEPSKQQEYYNNPDKVAQLLKENNIKVDWPEKKEVSPEKFVANQIDPGQLVNHSFGEMMGRAAIRQLRDEGYKFQRGGLRASEGRTRSHARHQFARDLDKMLKDDLGINLAYLSDTDRGRLYKLIVDTLKENGDTKKIISVGKGKRNELIDKIKEKVNEEFSTDLETVKMRTNLAHDLTADIMKNHQTSRHGLMRRNPDRTERPEAIRLGMKVNAVISKLEENNTLEWMSKNPELKEQIAARIERQLGVTDHRKKPRTVSARLIEERLTPDAIEEIVKDIEQPHRLGAAQKALEAYNPRYLSKSDENGVRPATDKVLKAEENMKKLMDEYIEKKIAAIQPPLTKEQKKEFKSQLQQNEEFCKAFGEAVHDANKHHRFRLYHDASKMTKLIDKVVDTKFDDRINGALGKEFEKSAANFKENPTTPKHAEANAAKAPSTPTIPRSAKSFPTKESFDITKLSNRDLRNHNVGELIARVAIREAHDNGTSFQRESGSYGARSLARRDLAKAINQGLKDAGLDWDTLAYMSNADRGKIYDAISSVIKENTKNNTITIGPEANKKLLEGAIAKLTEQYPDFITKAQAQSNKAKEITVDIVKGHDTPRHAGSRRSFEMKDRPEAYKLSSKVNGVLDELQKNGIKLEDIDSKKVTEYLDRACGVTSVRKTPQKISSRLISERLTDDVMKDIAKDIQEPHRLSAAQAALEAYKPRTLPGVDKDTGVRPATKKVVKAEQNMKKLMDKYIENQINKDPILKAMSKEDKAAFKSNLHQDKDFCEAFGKAVRESKSSRFRLHHDLTKEQEARILGSTKKGVPFGQGDVENVFTKHANNTKDPEVTKLRNLAQQAKVNISNDPIKLDDKFIRGAKDFYRLSENLADRNTIVTLNNIMKTMDKDGSKYGEAGMGYFDAANELHSKIMKGSIDEQVSAAMKATNAALNVSNSRLTGITAMVFNNPNYQETREFIAKNILEGKTTTQIKDSLTELGWSGDQLKGCMDYAGAVQGQINRSINMAPQQVMQQKSVGR